jgi:hypothetical protein
VGDWLRHTKQKSIDFCLGTSNPSIQALILLSLSETLISFPESGSTAVMASLVLLVVGLLTSRLV